MRLAVRFSVMDCTQLDFPDGFLDNIVTIATTHLLDDALFQSMVRDGLRVSA